MPRTGRELVAPLAVVLLCLAAFFLVFVPRNLHDIGPLSLGSSFDFQSYFRPRFWLSSDELFRGRLPTWNRYEYGGMPLLATAQPAALYPPKAILFWLFDPVTANWIFLVLHYAIVVGGFAWFLRTQGLGGPSLFVGVALWTFGTALLASNYHPTRIACLSWMPIAFVVAERLVKERSPAHFAALAVVVTLQIFAGYPEFTIDLGLLLALHVTVRWKMGALEYPPWKSVPLLAGAFVLAAVAAGLQLLPLAEIAQVARRVAMADKAEDFAPALIGVEVPMPVVPGLVAFALIGFLLRPARPGAVGFVVCWALAVGGWRLLRYLPGFSMVRFPLAWVFLASFFFAWVGAVGAHAVVRGTLGPKTRRVAAIGVGLSAVGIAAVAVAAWQGSHAATPGRLAATWKLTLGSPIALGLALAGATAALGLAVRAFLARVSPDWAWLAALGCLAGAHVAAYPHGASPATFAPPTPKGLVATLHGRPKAITGRSLCTQDLLYGHEVTDRLPSALGVEISFLPWRQRELLGRLHFLPTFGHIDWNKALEARAFWDAMDVQFFVAHTSLIPLFMDKRLWPVNHNGEFMLFENRDRMGHAWVNYAVRRVTSDVAALDHVLGRSFDPRAEVVLEEPTRRPYPATSPHQATPASYEHRRSPIDVEYEVSIGRPGVFVISEAAYPGWTATVDGKPAPWLRANYVLRAVELEAGTHKVRFRYRPLSVVIGAVSTCLGLAAIVALFVVAFRARRAARAAAVPAPAVS